MLEIKLRDSDAFLQIKETLTRIGIASLKQKTIYQTAHILHKRGKYYIVHFKELFKLDDRPTNLTQDDIDRRTTIAILLQQWGLLTIVNCPQVEYNKFINSIKIIPFNQKHQWNLVPKYRIGIKHKY